MVIAKGEAMGHRISHNPYRESTYTPKSDNGTTWKWTDIDSDSKLGEIYDYLSQEKLNHLRNESSMDSVYSESDLESRVSKASNEASRETRDKLIKDFYTNSGMTQQELANAIDIPRGTLAPILSDPDKDS
jgi:DNA-binding transcriptional regulator YiaG